MSNLSMEARPRNQYSATPMAYHWNWFHNFDFDRFASKDNLYRAFEVIRNKDKAKGVDGVAIEHLSNGEVLELCKALSRCLKSSEFPYRRQPLRRVEIPKFSGGYREIQIPTVRDRLVLKAFQIATADFWHSKLPFLRQSRWNIVWNIELACQAGNTWIGSFDIANCYPSLSLASAIDFHQEALIESIGLGRTEPLHELCLSLFPNEGNDGDGGIPQGASYAATLAENFLHTIFKNLEEDGTSLLRYVDNIYVTGNSRRQVEESRANIQQTLGQHQLRLKDEQTILDLSRNYVECLGIRLKWDCNQQRLITLAPQDWHETMFESITQTDDSSIQRSLTDTYISAYASLTPQHLEESITERLSQLGITPGRYSSFQELWRESRTSNQRLRHAISRRPVIQPS